MGMELILLISIRAPWKARFFSLPFVFLKASPLVSFSLSYPNWPQWSAYCPNLAFAWKELSFSYSRIGPTSSMFILENDFLGPLSTSLGYVLYYLCGLFTRISYFLGGALTTTSSYYSQSCSSSDDDLGFSFFFFLSFAAFFSSLAYFLSFFLGYSSKESSYDSYYSDSIFFFPLLFFSGIMTSSCFFASFASFSSQRVLGLSNLAIQLDLPVGACSTGLERIGLATLFLILLILASTFGLDDFLLWSNDCLRVVTPCSGQIRFWQQASIFQLERTYSLMALASPFLRRGLLCSTQAGSEYCVANDSAIYQWPCCRSRWMTR